MGKIRTAVVTGSHPFDVINFHGLFRSFQDADCYIQHLDDFASSDEKTRDAYDVVLFFFMPAGKPSDEGGNGYQGKPLSAIRRIIEQKQPIFALHHSILAYPDWPEWGEIVGYNEERSFTFDNDQRLALTISDPNHPITTGLDSWDLVDESYGMANPVDSAHILITTDHPKSMEAIAWVLTHHGSRVFCFQSGHDVTAWADQRFKTIVQRGIQWCAGRI
ncbi:MAG: hypothetical protein CMN78_02395 [Spirochaetales bacterium]|nr:hypothetical protein [Spirochaetales bacterium]